MSTQRIKVWDLFIRGFHWLLVLSFLVAFVTEDELLNLHVLAGYTILALVTLRILWGLVGTRYARFSEFVRSPRVVVRYLMDVLRGHAKRYLGHNPAGGVMVVLLLSMLLLTGLSGLMVYGTEEMAGPLASWLATWPEELGDVLEEVHEVLAYTTLLLVVLHVAGVIFTSYQHRENLVAAMVNGYKESKEV